MIQSTITTKASPQAVWVLWKKKHGIDDSFYPGNKGRPQGTSGLTYRILEVSEGRCFKILWKSFFTRLVFTHSVNGIEGGSEICYQVDVRGIFSWPLERLLKNKIQKNLNDVLLALANELKQNRF